MSAHEAAHHDGGFSLVELLIAMAIVGLLAAVSVPIFLGQTALAQDAAVRSDLASSRQAFVSIVILDTERTEENLRKFGHDVSTGTSRFEIYINEADLGSERSDWWCLQETSATGTTFHVGAEGGITEGGCGAPYTRTYYADGDFS